MIRYIFSDKWWPYHRNENHQRPCLYNANERAIVNRLHDRAAHSRPVYISAHEYRETDNAEKFTLCI